MISLAIQIFMTVGFSGFAIAAQEDPYKKSIFAHDLQDIQKSAELFLKSDRSYKDVFFVTAPNPKITVERCTAPLQSAWDQENDEKSQRKIRISCPHTASSKGWQVLLPITQRTNSK